MRISHVREAKFLDGVYLGNSVRQSVALARDAVEDIRTGGVFRVKDMQPFEYGLGVQVEDRWFLVPWARVGSCEIVPEDESEAAAPEADSNVPRPAVRVDQGKRRA